MSFQSTSIAPSIHPGISTAVNSIEFQSLGEYRVWDYYVVSHRKLVCIMLQPRGLSILSKFRCFRCLLKKLFLEKDNVEMLYRATLCLTLFFHDSLFFSYAE